PDAERAGAGGDWLIGGGERRERLLPCGQRAGRACRRQDGGGGGLVRQFQSAGEGGPLTRPCGLIVEGEKPPVMHIGDTAGQPCGTARPGPVLPERQPVLRAA